MAEDWLGGLVPPLLIIIGILGIVVPVLPGLFITLVGAFVWALITSSTTGWVISMALSCCMGSCTTSVSIPRISGATSENFRAIALKISQSVFDS